MGSVLKKADLKQRKENIPSDLHSSTALFFVVCVPGWKICSLPVASFWAAEVTKLCKQDSYRPVNSTLKWAMRSQGVQAHGVEEREKRRDVARLNNLSAPAIRDCLCWIFHLPAHE